MNFVLALFSRLVRRLRLTDVRANEALTEEEYGERIMKDRCASAGLWLRRLPKFPPNTERLTIVIEYDDGYSLEMKVSEKR
jgi:hypothetical protein